MKVRWGPIFDNTDNTSFSSVPTPPRFAKSIGRSDLGCSLPGLTQLSFELSCLAWFACTVSRMTNQQFPSFLRKRLCWRRSQGTELRSLRLRSVWPSMIPHYWHSVRHIEHLRFKGARAPHLASLQTIMWFIELKSIILYTGISELIL